MESIRLKPSLVVLNGRHVKTQKYICIDVCNSRKGWIVDVYLVFMYLEEWYKQNSRATKKSR